MENPETQPSKCLLIPSFLNVANEMRNSYVMMHGPMNIKLPSKFHCFTVHFDSVSFIHTNSCTFSYNYVSVFKVILKSLKTL